VKTQIVNIDVHDDYGSIRDKLLWTKARRVILVWPGRGDVLTSRLDLVLLKRLGQQENIALGLLTFDPRVIAHAIDLSIPVFEDLENTPESSWDQWQTDIEAPSVVRPQRDTARPERQTEAIPSSQQPLIRLLVLLLPIAAFIFALVILLPSAHISLQPVTLRELETISFTLDQEPTTNKLSLSYEKRELEVQGELRIPTSGRSNSPDQAAQGQVVFTNLTDEAISIPAGTSVRSSALDTIYFRTDHAVHLAAGIDAQATVDVTAALSGPDGNIPEAAIDTIDGILGLSLTVTNPASLSGGSLRTRSAVSETDVKAIKDALEDELKAESITRMAGILLPNEAMLDSTYQIEEVLSAEYDAAVGNVADSLSLDLTQLITISVIDLHEVQMIAADYLRSDLAPGYVFAPGSPEVSTLRDTIDPNSGEVGVDVDFSVRSFPEINAQKVRQIALGTVPDEFVTELRKAYAGELAPEIIITPSWWPRLPFFTHQIDVEISLGDWQ
jgi:hypothetical protein